MLKQGLRFDLVVNSYSYFDFVMHTFISLCYFFIQKLYIFLRILIFRGLGHIYITSRASSVVSESSILLCSQSIIVMSLPSAAIAFSSLPQQYFRETFISEIQSHAEMHLNLQQLFQSYGSSTPQTKSMSIFKQQFFQNLVKKPFAIQILVNLYEFTTLKQYSIEEKALACNLVYRFIYLISELGMNKQIWKQIVEKETYDVSKRFNFQSQLNFSQKCQYQPPVLTVNQTQQLFQYLKENLLPFYEMLQKLLDQNQDFVVTAKFYQLEQQKQQKEYSLSEGKKLQVSEFIGLEALKQYIGDKPPQQEKKDPKKK